MSQALPAFPSFVTVGAGALASALAPALVEAGYRPAGVVSRDRKRAEWLADRLACPVVDWAGVQANLVVCCVPDDALESVVTALAAAVPDWSGRIVVHTSGARDDSVLAGLAGLGAVTCAFHPIQSFVYPSGPGDLRGVSVAIGGDSAGLAAASRLAKDLGLNVVRVPDDSRALYHLATAIASNGLVTLAALAADLLAECGIDRRQGLAALGPLVAATVDHVDRDGPDRALTGPVIRGDVTTVERHFAALAAVSPGLVSFYGSLVTETVRLAVRSGRLDRWSAARILDVVTAWVMRGAGEPFDGERSTPYPFDEDEPG